MTHYDMIIVGAGAGGGTLAYALASTGKNILILERGGFLPREKNNWNPEFIFQERGYQTQERWLDRENKPFRPEAFFNVGGNTKVYGATLQRMRLPDFEEIQHCEGVSPAWDISYEDMEPYYTRAESLYKIHGIRGEDPSEPPASSEYPHKPFPHEPRIAEIEQQLRDRGLHPFHLTNALDRDVDNPENAKCIRCNTCDPYPCLVDAKCDAEVTCINPALEYGNVKLITDAYVSRINTNEAGDKATGVEAIIDGKAVEFTGDIIVSSCGSINTAALLLRSANDKHPHGLANSSGMVGRNLVLHHHTYMIAIADKPNPTYFQKTLGVNDFYFKGPDQDYPLGQIQLTGKADWQRLKMLSPESVPDSTLQYMASHSVDWWISSEDLPHPDNRVTVNSEGKIKVDYTPNNLKPHNELVALWENILRELGFFMFWTKKMPLKTIWHQAGTCRFGKDPQKNVLDLNCRTHDLENLYVVDSSCLPCIGAVNPTLTIVANALRVGDHLKDCWEDTN